MPILKDAKKYWDMDDCAEISHAYFMQTASVLEQDLAELGIAVDGVRVLDLGCGTGRVPVMYMPSRYVGVDQSEKMLERARELIGDDPEVEFHCSTVYGFKTDEEFDTLLLIDVLPHLDTKGCISMFKRVLRNFDAETYVMRLFVATKGERMHYKTGKYGYMSISYTPEWIREELLPLGERYGKKATLTLASPISPSIVNGYIVATAK